MESQERETSFLHDMCYNISSFLYNLYMLKVYEYKAHFRTLLDTCEGVLNRSFYKNDINAVPIITTILR